MKKVNIAIDGPSGAGKSSIADELAEQLGFIHLDTGAMYRALTYTLDQMGIEPGHVEKIRNVLPSIDLQMNGNVVFINGEDLSDRIRSERISRLTSQYAANPDIRKKLVEAQQQAAAQKGYILDGRDICDVVLPDAEVKIYLDASDEERARRRFNQLKDQGTEESFESVLQKIRQRDENDRNREVSPLRRSKEAVYVDTSELDFDQSVDALKKIVEKALQGD